MKRKKHKSNKLQAISLFFESEDNSKKLSFAEVCIFIRETFNTTQAEMAEKFKVNLRTYQYWEYGETSPSPETAFDLCLLYLHAQKEAKENTAKLKQPEEVFSVLQDSQDNFQTPVFVP